MTSELPLHSSQPDDDAPAHFAPRYIDDIGKINPDANYFSPVWADVVSITGGFQSMLDIGCGNGVFAVEARRRTGCELCGVDGSDYAIQQATNAAFDALALIADFNVDALPYPAGRFDFCLCKDLLEHLLRPDRVIEEAYRVLKDNGSLLVHVPNHFSLSGRVKFLLNNEIDTQRYFPGAKRWDFPHVRFFTWESIAELLRLKGFEIVEDLSHHFPDVPFGKYLVPFRRLRAALARRYPSQFAGGFTVLARKTVRRSDFVLGAHLQTAKSEPKL